MATNCLSVTSGYAGSICRNSAGGVSRFYIANISDVDASTIATNSDEAITELDIDALYAYVPYVDSSSWTETINVSPENGTIYYEQVANMVLGANSQALRNIVEDLGHARNIIVIVLDNNERYWLIGDYTGKKVTYLSGGDCTSGTALGDRNGYSLNITCRNNKPATEILPASASQLKAAIEAADAFVDGGSGSENIGD